MDFSKNYLCSAINKRIPYKLDIVSPDIAGVDAAHMLNFERTVA